VVCPCTNTDHVTVREDQNIISLQGETTFLEGITSTAEHTLFLILSMLRGHTVGTPRRDKYCRTLKGKHVGVIGVGRIGCQVIDLLHAFGATTTWYDPKYGHSIDQLDYLFRNSDIITLHPSIKPSQKPIIDHRAIALMKQGVYLCNTSRGSVVDSQAVEDNLNKFSGIATDFPIIEESFNALRTILDLHYIYQTPHCGGYSIEDVEKTYKLCMSKLFKEKK